MSSWPVPFFERTSICVSKGFWTVFTVFNIFLNIMFCQIKVFSVKISYFVLNLCGFVRFLNDVVVVLY